jgi:hypothetical protein
MSGLPGGPRRWQVMREPEGNEFCIVRDGSDGLIQAS